MKILPSKLEWYIGKNVLLWIVYITAFLCLLSWLIKFMEQLRVVGTGSYTLLVAMYAVTLRIPYNLYLFFPISALIGTVIALCLMSANSELVICQSAGMSKLKIAIATMKFILPLMVGIMFVSEFVSPYTEAKYDEVRAKHIKGIDVSKSPTTGNLWIKEGENFINIGIVDADGVMHNIEKFTFLDNSGILIDRASAISGIYEDGKWKFNDVKHVVYPNNSEQDIKFYTNKNEVWNLAITPDKFNAFSTRPDDLSISSLVSYVKYLHKNKLKSDRYDLELYRKIFAPLAIVTMIFLASAVSFGSTRSLSANTRIVIGIVLGFAFYVANQTISPLSLVYGFHPLPCVVLPSLSFLFVALYFLCKR